MSHRVITPTERVVQVVEEEKSILDQILELPNESVVQASAPLHPNGRSRHTFEISILHRTGPSGWLVTRIPGGLMEYRSRAKGSYLGEAFVRTWVEHYELSGATFEVLSEGRA